MSDTELLKKIPGVFRKWVVTLWVMFLSFCSMFSSYVCLSDKTTKPFVGGVFCLFGAFVLMVYYALEWRKGRDINIKLIIATGQQDDGLVVRESIAILVLKWIISIFTCIYACLSSIATLICLFPPSDKAAYPMASLLYLSSGAIVVGALVATVWKKWSTP